MTTNLRLALGQLNLLVGDIAGNVEKMRAATRRAREELRAHVVVFPELALTGYPPEDLLLRPGFIHDAESGLKTLCAEAAGIDVIAGHPWRDNGRLYNAASLLRDGRVHATYRKHCLPNYGVFDEQRYFKAGEGACVVEIAGLPVGLTVCEDLWEAWPIVESVRAGARAIVNINASPYHRNKIHERLAVLTHAAQANRVPIVYLNLVGGQDELVFDGDSLVVGADGKLAQQLALCAEELVLAEIAPGDPPHPLPAVMPAPLTEEASVYATLVLGVRDYIEKNRFAGAVLGLSGGIDSALTLCVAVDAIGPERVQAVMMPSRYTAQMSLDDARAQAEALSVPHSTIPIEPMFAAFLDALKDEFRGRAPDTTEENLQARIRGMLLMAISNKTGRIVLTTGNKSEVAVGYATLYGDMAGGFAVIKDVPKTLVYRLAGYRNGVSRVIPQRVMDRPPSAELKPDQKDTDSLPPYDTLDPILERYVEGDQSVEEIVLSGFDADVVRRVAAMVDRNEYKRRQAPPGVRITPRAFGRDRRYPITSGYGRGRR
jgi:NAD+ synthase (glutamine-hydrolysing)